MQHADTLLPYREGRQRAGHVHARRQSWGEEHTLAEEERIVAAAGRTVGVVLAAVHTAGAVVADIVFAAGVVGNFAVVGRRLVAEARHHRHGAHPAPMPQPTPRLQHKEKAALACRVTGFRRVWLSGLYLALLENNKLFF